MKIAIVSLLRNEGAHLAEWLRWHRAVGVTAFHLFDHESTDDTSRILSAYSDVQVRTVIGPYDSPDRPPLYVRCLRDFQDSLPDYDWVAVIDGDEYLVPLSATTLTGVLEKASPGVGAIAMNWKHFGEREPGTSGCLSITRCGARHNLGFKSISRPVAWVDDMYCTHSAPCEPLRFSHDLTHRPLVTTECHWQTSRVSHVNLQVNHYKYRSLAEWDFTHSRNSLDGIPRRLRGPSAEDLADWNSGEDLRAYELAKFHGLL